MCIYELLQHVQQQNFLVEYWVGGVLVFGFFFWGGGWWWWALDTSCIE